MSCAVVVRRGTALVSFKKRSAISNSAKLLLFDSIYRPRMSILTHTKGSEAGKCSSFVALFQAFMRLWAQEVQCFTIVKALTLIHGQ